MKELLEHGEMLVESSCALLRKLQFDFDDPLVKDYWNFENELTGIVYGYLQSDTPMEELSKSLLNKVDDSDIAVDLMWLEKRITTNCSGWELFDEVNYRKCEEQARHWCINLYGILLMVCVIYQLYMQARSVMQDQGVESYSSNRDAMFLERMVIDILNSVREIVKHISKKATKAATSRTIDDIATATESSEVQTCKLRPVLLIRRVPLKHLSFVFPSKNKKMRLFLLL